MKKRNILLLAAAVMAVSGSVQAEEGSLKPMAQTGVSSEEGAGAVSELSDDWADYQIQIDDEVYQFPMMYADFTAMGWTPRDTEETELKPNQYDMIRFTKDDAMCTAYILNLGMNNETAENCIVGGISIDNFDWELETGEVTLPGGIVRGQADVDTIQAAYGTPSDTYEGDLYTKLTYEIDYNSSVEMAVYKESGVLEDIDLRNFVEPEGFDAGEVSEEVPAAVSSYTKPEVLSDNLEDYQMELDGEVYALPVPVSVLAADGWELDEGDSDSEIKAGSFGWVTLRKGGQEIREIAVNPESYATIPENCWVEGLTAGGYTLDAEGVLPGGIRTGMAEEEFVELLEAAGMSYEVDDSSDSFKYYVYNEKEYDQCFEVTVYTAEDGYFEKDTIMEISCSNAF
ncbi:MAG: hypothetical protein Q4C61_17000 [Lachnospiraceae bacterium]|nr:hypothetical protein [Lachnospiraceae bacterium]